MRVVQWSREDRVYTYVTSWKMNFCSKFLRLSLCKDSPQIAMLWWKWWGRLKRVWTLLCRFLQHLVGVRESGSPIVSLFGPCRSTYIAYRLCTFTEMHVKWSVTLADRLIGSWDLDHVWNRGTSFASCLHLKVPGWLSNLNVLLTRKLPMFLSRLNEISGGRGNVFSFGIIAENFEVFENDSSHYKVLWITVGEGEWDSVGVFVLWRLQCGF